MRLRLLHRSVALALGMTLAGSVWANEAAVKYRQNQMAALGGHMGSIVALVKGEVPFSDQLAAHAQGLEMTSKFTKSVFEQKATGRKSASKPAVWEEWDRFAADADKLSAAAEQLAQAAAAGDQSAVRKFVAEVGKTCKGCHDRFKNK